VNSSMISKIEKAHRYAKEPERVRLQSIQSTFHGSHDDYQVALIDGRWQCTCHAFSSHAVGTCAHVMALQHLLSPMLSVEDRYGGDEVALSRQSAALAN
jgi:hypothetical protein